MCGDQKNDMEELYIFGLLVESGGRKKKKREDNVTCEPRSLSVVHCKFRTPDLLTTFLCLTCVRKEIEDMGSEFL